MQIRGTVATITPVVINSVINMYVLRNGRFQDFRDYSGGYLIYREGPTPTTLRQCVP